MTVALQTLPADPSQQTAQSVAANPATASSAQDSTTIEQRASQVQQQVLPVQKELHQNLTQQVERQHRQHQIFIDHQPQQQTPSVRARRDATTPRDVTAPNCCVQVAVIVGLVAFAILVIGVTIASIKTGR